MKLKCWSVLVILSMMLCGCARHPDVNVSLHMQAATYLNPDVNGNAAPVMLSIYELKTPMTFKQASYDALENNASAVLQNDLIDRQTLEIRPGQTLDQDISMARNAGFVGITAGYRNIDQATWRALIPLPPKANQIHVVIDVQSENLEVRLGHEGDWL